MIGRDNCEAFFLDYYEENLSPAQVKELYSFLDANPDLREMFEEYEHISLEDVEDTILGSKEIFIDKDLLKKEVITAENVEEYIILYHDNVLTVNEKEQLERFLKKNPEFSSLKEMYGKTILKPDTSIVFWDKSKLKKEYFEITSANGEDKLIEYNEGLMGAIHAQEFEKYISTNEGLQLELKKLNATKLVADHSIVFPDKQLLYDIPKRKRRGIFYLTAAAAGLIILLLSYFVLNNSQVVEEKMYSSNTASIDSNAAIDKDEKAVSTTVTAETITAKPVRKKSNLNKTSKNNSIINDTNSLNTVINAVAVTHETKSVDTSSVVATATIPPVEKGVVVLGTTINDKRKNEIKQNEYLSMKDFFINRVRAKEKVKGDPDCEGKRNKLTINDMIALGTALIKKAGGSKVEIVTQENACGEAVAVMVRSGNWEFESPLIK